jgi:hypothetical protein
LPLPGPPANVTVWEALSSFVHVTVVPAWTVRSAGAKAKSLIVAADAYFPPLGADGAAVGAALGAALGLAVDPEHAAGDAGQERCCDQAQPSHVRASSAVPRLRIVAPGTCWR